MLRKAIHTLHFQMKQSFMNPRIPLLLLLVSAYIFATVQPVGDFSKEVQEAVTVWSFPHITNDYICQLVIMAVAVGLFCDAPFHSSAYWYILPRSGNTAWAIGMCLYIIILSFLYIFLILFVGIVALLPNIQPGSGWGRIWGTLARTDAGNYFHLQLVVNDYIIGAYQPIKATIICFLLAWGCCTWLGLLSYCLNNFTESNFGSVIATGFVLLDIAVYNTWSYTYFRISPLTLAQLSQLVSKRSIYGVDLRYSVTFFGISIAALILLCVLSQHCTISQLRERWPKSWIS